MLNKLTKKQEDQLSVYRDKWIKIGLSTQTGEFEKEKIEALIGEAYKAAGLDPPKMFIYLKSPLQGAIGAHWLSKLKDISGIQVGAQVRERVGYQVGDQVRTQVGTQVRTQVWERVGDQVGDQVRTQVGDQVRERVGAQVGDQLYRAVYGNHDSDWLSFYEFFYSVCGVKTKESVQPLIDLASLVGWWWPFMGAAIITEKPSSVHRREKRLHCDHGPAIRYSDDFCIWALNGIRMPREIVETPADKLDASLVLKEKNAEIRAEIVKKIGINRVLKDLNAKTIDTMDEYELLLLDLQDGRFRPYLKMKNPSIEEIHVEGVHPDCKTVAQALAWRNGMETYTKPVVLT